MALALKKIKVYLKLAAIVTALVILLLLVLNNSENTVNVWFFWYEDKINVLWLILITSVSSIVGWWAFRKVFSVIREFREVRRQSQAQMQLDEQRRLAQEMAERERRIDEKVRRSISSPKVDS
jgi:hypothetical protein